MRLIICSIFILSTILCIFANDQPKVPCYFIFGDSLSDAGNNNMLITMAKANYPPYGVDFPGGIPTGRFTNGITSVDFITQYLGFDSLIKPYKSNNITNQEMLRGVNFASGSAGILDATGITAGDRISFNRQLLNYRLTILKLQLLVQGPVANYLNKCLFTVNIGSNDYIGYFIPQNNITRNAFNPEKFAEKLIAQYKGQLQALYNTGARKIGVFGLGKIGCTIAEIAIYNSTQCVEEINQAVEIFNTKLVLEIDNFNANLHGAQFTLFNVSSILDSTIIPLGINTSSPCCILRSDYECEPFTPPCANRNMYAYMDGFHPTQIVNEVFATTIFNTTNPSFVHPVNISKLTES